MCVDDGTAPNAYSLPPAMGTLAFSISGRGKSPMDERVLNPGPGQYESASPDKYKSRSPCYSMSSRTTIPSDHTQKPGPGAHSPEKVPDFAPRRYGLKSILSIGGFKCFLPSKLFVHSLLLTYKEHGASKFARQKSKTFLEDNPLSMKSIFRTGGFKCFIPLKLFVHSLLLTYGVSIGK